MVGQVQKIDEPGRVEARKTPSPVVLDGADGSWPPDRFEVRIRALSSQLRRMPSSDRGIGIRAALETLAGGFSPERVLLFQATSTADVFELSQCWQRGEDTAGEAFVHALDLRPFPELVRHLNAGSASGSRLASDEFPAWRKLQPETLILPCLAAQGLLGVIVIEAGLLRGSGGKEQEARGLAVADILAAFLERIQLEAQLAVEADRAGAARSLAHDFNNLLTAILGYADLLELELPEGGVWQQDLSELRTAATRAVELVEGQLRPGPTVSSAPLDLGEHLESLRGLLAGVLGPKVALQIAVEKDLAPIAFDATTLERMILNLASNARDAIDEAGTGSGCFRLAARTLAGPSPARFVRLIASDDGAGITPEARERLFEVGWTSKPPGKGHGLGLASIASAMDAAGGSIRLAPSPSRGTVFHLDFPIG